MNDNKIEDLELKISKFLRLGIIVAGVLILGGWLVQLKFVANPFYNFEYYDQIPLQNLVMFHIRTKQWGYLVSYLGLFCLISLPIIRVFLTAILFVKQKEYVLANLAFFVLVGLLGSLFLGIEL